MKALSRDACNLIGQPMFKLMARTNELEAVGRKILHFEIGEPGFMSPASVIASTSQALAEGKTHYVNSMGIRELRDAVCDFTEKDLGYRPTREQVLICPANAIIYFLIRCVVNRGEEIIIPNPGFPTYYAAIKFTSVKAVPVPLREENYFRMSPGDIRKRITDRTRLIVINSPNNPTGSVMTKEEIGEVASIAEDADIYLLSDEVYGKMTYDVSHYSPSIKDRCRERTILLNSFSKAYSMTGWRLGYAIGPEEVIGKMGLLLQTTISCLPPFIQYGGITALIDGQKFTKEMMEELRRRRDITVSGLNRIRGISCLNPEGAFYVFPNITETGLSSEQFANVMLEEAGVALLPGTDFGEYGQGYVRLSYAVSRPIIEEAIEKIGKVLGEK